MSYKKTKIFLVGSGAVLGLGLSLIVNPNPEALRASMPAPVGMVAVNQQAGWRPAGESCVGGQTPNKAGLEIFGDGEYFIDMNSVVVAGEDSLDEEGAKGLLGGLVSISLPNLGGIIRRHQITSNFDMKVGGKSVCLPPSAKSVASFGWCSFGGTGEHGVRFSLHQTMRTKYESGMKFPGCPPKCMGWDGIHDCEEKKLRPGVQAVMYPGLGLPVAKWQSADPQYSLQSADKLYKRAIFDESTIASNQSIDIIAGGVVVKVVKNGVRCPWDAKQIRCKEYNYFKRLAGTMVRRTYNDLRIGLGADSSGGLQVRANFTTLPTTERFVVPGPGVNTSLASLGDRLEWKRQKQFNALFDRFCGRKSADAQTVCGRPVGMANEATGGSIIAARDDSLRAMQLCAKLSGGQGPDDCASGKNPLAPTAPDDESTLAAMAQDRLSEGARNEDTVSTVGKIETGQGERTLEDGEVQSMGSQWQRGCRKIFARDSLRAIGRGEDMGPVRQGLLTCLLKGGER